MRSLPKAEVHVHLEGCFDVGDLVELARTAGEPLPRPPERLFEFSDFDSFLSFLDWEGGLVRTPEQLARAAFRFAAREAASGVRYADMIVNITHWAAWRGRLEGFIDALDHGLAEAEQDGLTPVGVCVSLLRQMPASEADKVVDRLLELGHPRVVALSIDGNEARAGRTGPRFAQAFRRAGAGGLKRAVHAGESSGPGGVWDALDLLGADRIDHGVRAVEDAVLVRQLVERRIPLDMCPGTNLTIGLYPDRASHPFDQLRTAGVIASVNTDDPSYQSTNLETEYTATADAYGWGAEVARQVARNSIEASFCNEDLRRTLLAELDAWEA